MDSVPIDVFDVRDDLKSWLLQHAYPVWWARGVNHDTGDFHEKINQNGTAVHGPRRGRVPPRQIYAFAAAQSLGWVGPWRDAVGRGLNAFLEDFRRPDGMFRTLVSDDGVPLDDEAFLYDQAFALLGLAAARTTSAQPEEVSRIAVDLRQQIYAQFGHLSGGFCETSGGSRALLSNPHMHLFEASLIWAASRDDTGWLQLADEIGGLALGKMIDPRTGGVREYFDAAWNPAPGVDGRILEPGHQFEWAWLLMRWGNLRDRRDAIDAALRLIELGETAGVDLARGVAINSILDDGSVRDANARLWPQTERIKASASAVAQTGDQRYWTGVVAGGRALLRYLETPVRGLWYDLMNEDGRLTDQPAPASSFYHIVCAIAELDTIVDSLCERRNQP